MLYILEFHERNLYTYAGGFGRAFCVKKRVAPARVRASKNWKRREQQRKSPRALYRVQLH